MKRILFIWLCLAGYAALGQACEFHYGTQIKTFVTSKGHTWAYQEVGKRSKIPTLFLHGLGGNSSHWSQNQVAGIRLDLAGYGYSSNISDTIPKEETLTYLADEISQFMLELGIPRFDVVGHSMGGQIAIWMGIRAPERVRRLILLAPAGLETFTTAESALLQNIATPTFYAQQDQEQIRQGFQANFVKLPAAVEPLIQDRIQVKTCQPAYFQSINRGVIGMLRQPVSGLLSQLQQPTLVIFGKEDQLIPNKYLHPKYTIQDIADLAEVIPNSQIKILEGAGHMLMFEKPKHIDTYIKTYLTKRKL